MELASCSVNGGKLFSKCEFLNPSGSHKLSTSGAVIALVEAIRAGGGQVVDVICAVEKVGNDGFKNVQRKTVMKIVVRENGVEVI
ncbi:hypothetical protein GIW56_27140 [Pseudomonas gessardii]|uniref:Tryptophan synthase beta chain-like PALP domain-containing protein n=1 Tax=Pseudomonas gessardii TaxID=78544 RepID=A0ABS9FDS1_9PSED|nr:hypothetical protein [Pseudomonas gessardii]MCF5110485.1 hypothetical protein [Pseudomonas gessardii]